MNPRSLLRSALSALLGVLLLFGCLSTPEDDPGSGNPQQGGWDDFPNKYGPDLKELAENAKYLPIPLGVRYEILPPESSLTKRAAAPDTCPDGEIWRFTDKQRGFYMADTVRFFDKSGVETCRFQVGLTQRVTHNRHILNLASGESWETLVDSLWEQDVLPRHRIRGTGRMNLHKGLSFTIDSYELDYYAPIGDPEMVVLSGRLILGWRDGYWVDLKIVKRPIPFKTMDFFSANKAHVLDEKIMSGEIRKDSVVVGSMDLYGDHSVLIRNWEGAPVDSP